MLGSSYLLTIPWYFREPLTFSESYAEAKAERRFDATQT
jgi:hypothetical protein